MLHKLQVDQDVNQSIADPCLYTKCEVNDVIMMLVWVDDIIIAASNDNALDIVKRSLKDKFTMRNMGKLSWFLGNEFISDKDGSTNMNQKKYCEKILEKLHRKDGNPKSIPCD